MSYQFKSLSEAVTEYIRVIEAPANGWSQHIDNLGRQSHALLWDVQREFGFRETHAELDRQFTAKEAAR